MVSVILPVRNALETIDECLRSIARQSLVDYELLIVDDGSTDGTTPVLRAAAQGDERIRLFEPGRIGLVAALNLAITHARNDLLARMDADDIMLPRRLERQRDLMTAQPELAVVGALVELFPEEEIQEGYREYVRWQNSCVTPDEIAASIYVESPFAHPSVMMRRSILLERGCYAEGAFPEDYDLWLRLHAADYRMAKVDEILLRWRERPDRTSRTDPRYRRDCFDALRAEHLARDPRLHAREIVVWGAGRKTRQRVRLAIERGVQPVAFIDIDPDKIGGSVEGVRVHPPEWLDRHPRPLVLVYVTNHGAREEIGGRLESMGYRMGIDWMGVG